MPSPKVFVSSTCYDLGMVREQIRSFLIRLGYDPVMSEYSDVLFDPRTHTHTSCLQEVPNADLVVLLIGSRFGGRILPEALSVVDTEKLINASLDVSVLDNIEKLSITQLETLAAIDAEVPVFAFVDDKVMHDHFVYEKNKDLAGKISFPSIDKPETAHFIFEFINFLRHRTKGNSVVSFSRVEDIETHLRKQWAALFQRLLREQRERRYEVKKVFVLSEQIEDLKTAVISTLGNAQAREIAGGVVRYRRLADFLSGLNILDPAKVTQGQMTFEKLLVAADIVSVRDIPEAKTRFGRSALIRSDGTFYELRFGQEFLARVAVDWQAFTGLSEESRRVIFEALVESGRLGPSHMRYRSEKFDVYYAEDLDEDSAGPVSIDTALAAESDDDDTS